MQDFTTNQLIIYEFLNTENNKDFNTTLFDSNYEGVTILNNYNNAYSFKFPPGYDTRFVSIKFIYDDNKIIDIEDDDIFSPIDIYVEYLNESIHITPFVACALKPYGVTDYVCEENIHEVKIINLSKFSEIDLSNLFFIVERFRVMGYMKYFAINFFVGNKKNTQINQILLKDIFPYGVYGSCNNNESESNAKIFIGSKPNNARIFFYDFVSLHNNQIIISDIVIDKIFVNNVQIAEINVEKLCNVNLRSDCLWIDIDEIQPKNKYYEVSYQFKTLTNAKCVNCLIALMYNR